MVIIGSIALFVAVLAIMALPFAVVIFIIYTIWRRVRFNKMLKREKELLEKRSELWSS